MLKATLLRLSLMILVIGTVANSEETSPRGRPQLTLIQGGKCDDIIIAKPATDPLAMALQSVYQALSIPISLSSPHAELELFEKAAGQHSGNRYFFRDSTAPSVASQFFTKKIGNFFGFVLRDSPGELPEFSIPGGKELQHAIAEFNAAAVKLRVPKIAFRFKELLVPLVPGAVPSHLRQVEIDVKLKPDLTNFNSFFTFEVASTLQSWFHTMSYIAPAMAMPPAVLEFLDEVTTFNLSFHRSMAFGLEMAKDKHSVDDIEYIRKQIEDSESNAAAYAQVFLAQGREYLHSFLDYESKNFKGRYRASGNLMWYFRRILQRSPLDTAAEFWLREDFFPDHNLDIRRHFKLDEKGRLRFTPQRGEFQPHVLQQIRQMLRVSRGVVMNPYVIFRFNEFHDFVKQLTDGKELVRAEAHLRLPDSGPGLPPDLKGKSEEEKFAALMVARIDEIERVIRYIRDR
ncbi:MAG: hypothetical protein AB7N80_08365 [Bdellovibrionales bacterium]